MTAEQFKAIRVAGQLVGGFVIALSVYLMFIHKQALYFMTGYGLFWFLNYVVIHHFIGKHVITDYCGNSRSKTLIHPH